MSDDPEMPSERFILEKLEQRFKSSASARQWYEAAPLPGFSGATSQQLVLAGRASEVLDYIEAVDNGVFS
jgi:hypothetical protein